MKYLSIFSALLFIYSFVACQSMNSNPIPPSDHNNFKEYWYEGTAEISSYNLEQARYGEIHQGEAVTIFVTEDFSKNKQDKLDNPQSVGDDAVPVLKLNATRTFNTGVYTYNQMLSVFTPVSYDKYPHSLKMTMSSQDWCGQSFIQYNWEKDHFDANLYSYFESEGDIKFNAGNAMTEDEVWTRIRIAPSTLPVGKTKFIPGLVFSRLKHTDGKEKSATASISEKDDQYIYEIAYDDFERILRIHFSKKFPHEISYWEEDMKSGYGANAKVLTTKATKKKSMMLPYWKLHDNVDTPLRSELGLKN